MRRCNHTSRSSSKTHRCSHCRDPSLVPFFSHGSTLPAALAHPQTLAPSMHVIPARAPGMPSVSPSCRHPPRAMLPRGWRSRASPPPPLANARPTGLHALVGVGCIEVHGCSTSLIAQRSPPPEETLISRVIAISLASTVQLDSNAASTPPPPHSSNPSHTHSDRVCPPSRHCKTSR